MTRFPASAGSAIVVLLLAIIAPLAIAAVSVQSGGGPFAAYQPQLQELQKKENWKDLEALSRRILDEQTHRGGPDSADVNAASVWLARALEGQGRYGEAEPLLRHAVEFFERTGAGDDRPAVPGLLEELASLYRELGQDAKAEPLAKRAMDIVQRTHGANDPAAATAMNVLALIYDDAGELAKAGDLLERALTIRQQALAPDSFQISQSLNNLARLKMTLGQYEQAEPLLKRSLAIREKALDAGDPRIAVGLNGLANLYAALGRYQQAEPLMLRALELDERALGQNHPRLANNLNNLGLLYLDQGQYSKAEPLMLRALAIWEHALGPQSLDVSRGLNNLAGLYQAQGQRTKAETFFQRSLAIRERVLPADDGRIAVTLANLAALYRDDAQYAKAESLGQRALAIDEKAFGPKHPAVALTLEGLARTLAAQGQNARAEPLFERAVAIDQAVLGSTHPDTLAALQALAHNDLVQDRFAQAVKGLRTACAAAMSSTQTSDANGEAVQIAEKDSVNCSTLHALALWGWSGQGGGSTASDKPDALRYEAFEAVQRATLSAAGAALNHASAFGAADVAGVGAEARDYEAALLERQRLERDYANAAGQPRATEALHALGQARTAQSARISQLETALRARAPRYWDYRSPAPLSAQTLQSSSGPDATLLHANEALIVFLEPLGKLRGLTFAVTHEGLAWASTGMSGDELQSAVLQMRRQIDPEGYALRDAQGPQTASAPRSNSSAAFDTNLSFRIHQALLGDAAIQRIIADKTVLLFVPHASLTALPPGLLVTAAPRAAQQPPRDADLRATAWLLRSKAVALLPAVGSLRMLRELSAARARASDPLLAFADPVFAANPAAAHSRALHAPRALQGYYRDGIPLSQAVGELPELPGTRIEAEALRQALGAPPASLLLGRNASKAELMARNTDGRLARVKVLEFATHGLVAGDISDIAEPALVLAAGSKPQDILLRASEAATLHLNADWVLLSACNTASPDAPEAQGLSGLSRAFFFAGARSLLVSHWLVRDDVAPRLIPAMLKAERNDPQLSRAESLRRASLAVLDDPQLNAANPAAWAAFTLIGEAGHE